MNYKFESSRKRGQIRNPLSQSSDQILVRMWARANLIFPRIHTQIILLLGPTAILAHQGILGG